MSTEVLKSRRSSTNNTSKMKKSAITKEMYDAVTAELATYKGKYEAVVGDYKTLEERVNKQQAEAAAVVTSTISPDVSATLTSLLEQINVCKQDACMSSSGIANLQQQWSDFDERLNLIEEKLNRHSIDLEEQKQYSMRNDLFLRKLKNIPVKSNDESYSKFNNRFDTWVYQTLNNLLPNLESKLTLRDIDTSHVLFEGSDLVLVRFSNRRARNDVFFNKRDLKGHPDKVTITEHLTRFRFHLLNSAKDIVGSRNAWSKKCQIYVNIRNSVHLVWSVDEVRKLYGRNATAPRD